jgi:hypothetical protein
MNNRVSECYSDGQYKIAISFTDSVIVLPISILLSFADSVIVLRIAILLSLTDSVIELPIAISFTDSVIHASETSIRLQ